MSKLQQENAQATSPAKVDVVANAGQPEAKPIIATARPSLSDAESALMRRIPTSYATRTVSDVLGYIVGTEASGNEASTMVSLRKELGAAGSYIVINGKSAKLTDRLEGYLVNDEKEIGGRRVSFQKLEIEVTAVQQGGYRF